MGFVAGESTLYPDQNLHKFVDNLTTDENEFIKLYRHWHFWFIITCLTIGFEHDSCLQDRWDLLQVKAACF